MDCPPSMSLLSENVLHAADAVLVPLIPTPFAARTLDQLAGFVAGQPGDARGCSGSSRWPTAASACIETRSIRSRAGAASRAQSSRRWRSWSRWRLVASRCRISHRAASRPPATAPSGRRPSATAAEGPRAVEPREPASTVDGMSSPSQRYAAARRRRRYPALVSFRAGFGSRSTTSRSRRARRSRTAIAPWRARRPAPGKTVVGEFAVHLALEPGQKCFYTTPIKALSTRGTTTSCPVRRSSGRPADRRQRDQSATPR